LPGKRVGSIRVDYSFGEDAFSEISFVSLIDGVISDDLQNYYISDT